ncbi:MAG TPA: T9SS type A sorting domain-containing protein [Bacteroidia bacterium]|nr:T9SS type A sorting domain-containing protein [Bacteroidia bacterium]
MKLLSFLFLLIFTVANVHSQTCNRVVDYEDFANSQGFTSVGAGNVTITGGKGQWQGAICGSYDHLYRPLNDSLSNSYFKAEFNFTVLPNPIGHGPGAVLLAFTSGTEDFLTYDAAGNYAATDQDGLGIVIASPSISNNNINSWFIYLNSKEDTIRTIGAATISLSSAITEYYMIMERSSDTTVNMTLYTDSLQTTLLGMASNTVSANIMDLYIMQFGASTLGWYTREFNGTIDNVIICDDKHSVGISETNLQSLINVPTTIASNNGFSVESFYEGEIELSVYDLAGKLIENNTIFHGDTHIGTNWSPGMYLLGFRNNKGLFLQKKIVVY